MRANKLDRLARLNAYQLAGVAVATSTGVALAVLLALRRFLFTPAASARADEPETPVSARHSDGAPYAPQWVEAVPHHFTEELVVPGLTQTGEQVLREDMRNGRSREGV